MYQQIRLYLILREMEFGPDIWAASSRVLDAAVEKAYNGEKKIVWKEVLAGEKAFNETGEWLPSETLDVIREYLIAIKYH